MIFDLYIFSEYFIMKRRIGLCLIIFFVVYFMISYCKATESFEGSTKATVNFKEVMFDGNPALLVVDLDGSVVDGSKQTVGLDDKNNMTFDTDIPESSPTSGSGISQTAGDSDGPPNDPSGETAGSEMAPKEGKLQPKSGEMDAGPTDTGSSESGASDLPPPGSGKRIGSNVDGKTASPEDVKERLTHREITSAYNSKYKHDSCADFKDFMKNDSMTVDPITVEELIPDYKTKFVEKNVYKKLNELNKTRSEKVSTCRTTYKNISDKFDKFRNDRKLNNGDYEPRGKGCGEFASLTWKKRDEQASMDTDMDIQGIEYDEFRNTISTMERDTMKLVDKKREACVIKFTKKVSKGAIKMVNNRDYLIHENGAMGTDGSSQIWRQNEILDGDKLKAVQFESIDTSDKYASVKNSCMSMNQGKSVKMTECDPNDPTQMFTSNLIPNTNGRYNICHENQESNGSPLCFSKSSSIIKAMTPGLEDSAEFRWKIIKTYV